MVSNGHVAPKLARTGSDVKVKAVKAELEKERLRREAMEAKMSEIERRQAEKDRLQAEKDRKHQEEMREMREMMALMRKNMGMDVDVASGGGGQAQLQKSRAAEKRREEQKGVEGQISDVQQDLSEHGVRITQLIEEVSYIRTTQEKILDRTQPSKPKKRF